MMPLIPESSVGRKILMAISGLSMILFIILHVIGNATIYSRSINSYAEFLHSFPLVIGIYRIILFTLLVLHVIVGIQLYLEDRRAKPEGYAVKKSLSTTFAGRTMIWSGLLIGVFLLYHLLHFTLQVTHPAISSLANLDAEGRPDVFGMVVVSFQNVFITFVYVFAMAGLLLHLTHGIQSSFQSLGLSGERFLPIITRTGALMALILFILYVSIPIIILTGIMKGREIP